MTETELDDRVARIDAGEPLCGSDFCDSCGDCLACFGTGPCDAPGLLADDEPRHSWLAYSASGETVREISW